MPNLKELNELHQFFSQKMNDFNNQLSACDSGDTKLIKLQKEFFEFKSGILEQLSTLYRRADSLETYSRKNCLVLYGIPEISAEDVVDVAINFINDIVSPSNLTLTVENIDNCHRLRTSAGGNKPRPIIIKFVSYLVKKTIWFAKSNLKNKPYSISESMTSYRLQVLKKAKESFGLNKVWTIDGAIMVLLHNKIKRKLTSMEDLENVLSEERLLAGKDVTEDGDRASLASGTSTTGRGKGKNLQVEKRRERTKQQK